MEMEKRSILDVQYGDIIKNGNIRRKVLGRVDEVVFTSKDNNFEEAGILYHTPTELAEMGYKIEQPQEKEEEEMIDIDGSKISKSTIKEALKKHIG